MMKTGNCLIGSLSKVSPNSNCLVQNGFVYLVYSDMIIIYKEVLRNLFNANVALGGFWDPQPTPPAPKPLEPPKVVEPPKKKLVLNNPVKKETTPSAEFETWCTTNLTSWSSKIDGR